MAREMILIPKEKFDKILESQKSEKNLQSEYSDKRENVSEESSKTFEKNKINNIEINNPESSKSHKHTENFQTHNGGITDKIKSVASSHMTSSKSDSVMPNEKDVSETQKEASIFNRPMAVKRSLANFLKPMQKKTKRRKWVHIHMH